MKTRTLGRKKDHREAMLRNLARSLVLQERLVTTEAKAKDLKRVMDRWLAKAKTVAAAADSARLAGLRQLKSVTHDQAVVIKLISNLAVRSKGRTSGFVRSRRVSPRVGDAASRLELWLADKAETTPTKEAPKQATKQTA